MDLATFSLKIIKNMANCLSVSLKVCIFAPSEINSDAAVSNWAGDFGHPRRRLTRGVRQNVSAPFFKSRLTRGDFYRSYSLRKVVRNWRLIAIFLLIDIRFWPLNTSTSRASFEVWKKVLISSARTLALYSLLIFNNTRLA